MNARSSAPRTNHSAADRCRRRARSGDATSAIGNAAASQSHPPPARLDAFTPNLGSGQLHLATSMKTRSSEPCACVHDHDPTFVFALIVPVFAAERIANT